MLAMYSASLHAALPCCQQRIDICDLDRFWFTTRVTATHAGPLKFFGKSFKATNKKVLGAPECLSYTFNEQGKCTGFTGGRGKLCHCCLVSGFVFIMILEQARDAVYLCRYFVMNSLHVHVCTISVSM